MALTEADLVGSVEPPAEDAAAVVAVAPDGTTDHVDADGVYLGLALRGASEALAIFLERGDARLCGRGVVYFF